MTTTPKRPMLHLLQEAQALLAGLAPPLSGLICLTDGGVRVTVELAAHRRGGPDPLHGMLRSYTALVPWAALSAHDGNLLARRIDAGVAELTKEEGDAP